MRAFIWDLDGTLLDTYGVITSSLLEALRQKGLNDISIEEIRHFVLNYSVGEFISKICDRYGYPYDEISGLYAGISSRKMSQTPVRTIGNAAEILSYLDGIGDENYVYTHKGSNANGLLEQAGILKYFREVVTSKYGFPRKPAPDGLNYLIEKYDLDVGSTFYVGDRNLDIECARNAGVKGILYLDKNSVVKRTGLEDFVVDDLIRIKDTVPPPAGR